MTGYRGMTGDVHEYLKRFPGTLIHVAEITRTTGLRRVQVDGAVKSLCQYPRSGVTRAGKGFVRYDPIRIYKREAPPEPAEEAPPPAAVEAQPTEQPVEAECDRSGELFEAVARDKNGFVIVAAEDGTRDFVLVRRSLVDVMVRREKEYRQVEAFKESLRVLVGMGGAG